MRTYTTLDLGTQRPSSSPADTTPAAPVVGVGRGRGVLGRWRLTGLLGLFGTATAAGALTGCVSDPDCGVCDPDNLIIESIAGVNYAGKIVKLLGPECVGDDCPGEITEGEYFVEKVIPCLQTDDAMESPRGSDEWCRVSPLVVDSGVQFIFNNLLDPTSVELVRKQAVNPTLIEVFDWKTHIVHLEGPTTRFNGDYRPGATQTKPDLIERAVNLSCIENLAKQGIPFDHTADADLCDGTYKAEDGKVWPLKTILKRKNAEGKLEDTTIETYRGETDTRRQSQSCTPPQSGADTCCDTCDYEVSVNVAKYGVVEALGENDPAFTVDGKGQLKNDKRVSLAGATKCDPAGDKFVECKDFTPHVYRGNEIHSFTYNWDGEGKPETFHVPLQDKLRETHPDKRWAGHEQRTVPCQTTQDCTSDTKANLVGMECVGELGEGGPACNGGSGDECINRRCVAEWFGDCRADADTTGSQGYCVDKRWNATGAGACFTNAERYYVCENPDTCDKENPDNTARFQGKGSRFSLADSNFDGIIKAVEGCRNELGADADFKACDPFYQPAISPIPRYDRKETLPSSTRSCICEDNPASGCEEFVNSLCREDGDASKPIIKEKQGQYALKFVTRSGGVIYDPAVKGVLFLPADLGNVARSLVEACSAARTGGIKGFNIKDGWRANDDGGEFYENHDRAMCSSSEYKVVFNVEPDAGKDPIEYIRDKVGNTLKGKSTYVLHTPDFHVVPGSGFPTDNLRIGACDDFELRFSNKYDLTEKNLKKVQIVEISEDGKQEIGRVAGGLDCSLNPDDGRPCLTTNVRDQEIGAIRLSIDTALYGADVLVAGRRYRVKVPGLELGKGETVQKVIAAGGDRYNDAFWDACGMPLVTSMPPLDDEGKLDSGGKRRPADYLYDFKIDEPKPKEDKENDNVQFSCDNAPDHFNPDQADMDGDGFGDVFDLCPTVPGDNNKADTDKDGIGNSCDLCQRPAKDYNKNAGDAFVYMMVRNIPYQADYDRDGIGDVCDNCIVAPNCGDFGEGAGLTPAGISSTVPYDDANVCQVDTDALPYVGDACVNDMGEPLQIDGAAGPVGHLAEDDFDQDGITNVSDKCPRIRVEAATCGNNEECPDGAVCTDGVCNHVDSDGDGVGDLCDTCPAVANPKQIQDGGMQADDPDLDFVGNLCETNAACADSSDFRRVAFYSKSSNGQCCVQTFSEELGLTDPGYVEIDETSGECKVIDPIVPLKADCPEAEENVTCRKLPKSVLDRPGVVELPAGCDGPGEALTLDSPTIKGDENKLYSFACLMPQLDSDFDGIGDACELCEFAFDPDNAFYKDENNKVWPTYGKYCKGSYDPDKLLASCDEAPDSDGTDAGTAGSSGGEASGG